MCKFCEENKKLMTSIDDEDLSLILDEENRNILKIRIAYLSGMAVTKPIKIYYCPFCGKDLKELNCRICINYNLGDGVDDISYCKGGGCNNEKNL